MNWNLSLEDVLNNYKEYDSFKPLWYNDWYDGPIEGVGILIDRTGKSVDGKLYLYYILGDQKIEERTYQIFGFQELDDKERETEEFWQSLFEILVGSENREDHNYKQSDTSTPAGKFGRALYNALYNKFRVGTSIEDTKIIGWYKW